MTEKEYILFCDESDRTGRYYSSFYGGVIVGASQYQRITGLLEAQKAELNLFGEIKWSKVSANYLEKYAALMETFFGEVKQGNLRVRIMFRQNAQVPRGLRQDQLEIEYFLLYYQFIKHAFGLEHAPENLRLRLYFDRMPDTLEKRTQFKGFLLGLTKTRRWTGISIRPEDITEIRSHDHVLLQCLDVALGAISFRLNDKHKIKSPGSYRREKRTIAKERLYKAMRNHICDVHPNFNIGVSTGLRGDLSKRWSDPYLHWCFTPGQYDYDPDLTKPRPKKKNPT